MTVIYLSKNTTPFVQPLDQGIIRSFKAAYRRKYAQYLVYIFNSTGETPPPIDILLIPSERPRVTGRFKILLSVLRVSGNWDIN